MIFSLPTRKRSALIFSLAAAACAAGLLTLAGAEAPSTSVQFSTHLITDQLRGGYSVAIADVNHDGKLDIVPVAAGSPELAWYENPGWERHVMLNDKKAMLWASPADIDGDGIPEFALLSDFGQDPKTAKGSLWLLKSQGDPKAMWKSYAIDAVPTAHRVIWADLEGDGKKEIVMAPFVGLKGWEDPKYHDNVPLLFWRVPPTLDGPWKRQIVDDKLYGIVHHLHPVKWTPGKRFLAAQEPWHGDEIVVYSEKGGEWQRNVIFKGLVQGHEIAVGDLNGDGRDDIVAVDVTNRGRPTPASVHIFYSEDDAGTQWRHELLDENMMAGSGVVIADINGDGRPDIVAISGNSVKYYENLGIGK